MARREATVTTRVTVGIVLHDSAGDIAACLAALAAQTRPPDAIVVLDNASSDDGFDRARHAMPDARFERLPVNIGFAAAQNRVIALEPADVHIMLNPDCRLAAGIHRAIGRGPRANGRRIGAVSGRLLRFQVGSPDGGPPEELPGDVLDSTGMVAYRNRRVLDRSSDLPAAGRDPHGADFLGRPGPRRSTAGRCWRTWHSVASISTRPSSRIAKTSTSRGVRSFSGGAAATSLRRWRVTDVASHPVVGGACRP